MDLKDRKLKIAEFINSVDNGLSSQLIVTNLGGTATRTMRNVSGCINLSKSCNTSINESNCRNVDNNCNDSTNVLTCTTIDPPLPGTNPYCGTT